MCFFNGDVVVLPRFILVVVDLNIDTSKSVITTTVEVIFNNY
jgi:hypothetical protein